MQIHRGGGERHYVVKEGSHDSKGGSNTYKYNSIVHEEGNEVQQTITKKYISSSNAEVSDTPSHVKGPYHRKQGGLVSR